jgi:hypothetical protein
VSQTTADNYKIKWATLKKMEFGKQKYEYAWVDARVNQYSAQQICGKLGGSLVVINDPVLNLELVELLSSQLKGRTSSNIYGMAPGSALPVGCTALSCQPMCWA